MLVLGKTTGKTEVSVKYASASGSEKGGVAGSGVVQSKPVELTISENLAVAPAYLRVPTASYLRVGVKVVKNSVSLTDTAIAGGGDLKHFEFSSSLSSSTAFSALDKSSGHALVAANFANAKDGKSGKAVA